MYRCTLKRTPTGQKKLNKKIIKIIKKILALGVHFDVQRIFKGPRSIS